MKMKFNLHPLHLDKTLLMRIFLLVLLDQMIKRFIFHFCYNANTDLIDSVVQFYPVINPCLSLPGNFLPVFQNFHFLIIFNLLSLILIKYAYCFYQRKVSMISPTIRRLYMTFQAGSVASLLDKLLWGGSLDYIMINKSFIFDLKDCYLFGSVIVGTILMLLNYKRLKKIKRTEFLHFIIHKEEKT